MMLNKWASNSIFTSFQAQFPPFQCVQHWSSNITSLLKLPHLVLTAQLQKEKQDLQQLTSFAALLKKNLKARDGYADPKLNQCFLVVCLLHRSYCNTI